MSGRRIIAYIIAGAMIGLWISPGRAYSAPNDRRPAAVVKLERADRSPARIAVTYAERVGSRWYVELSNGAAYSARACRFEDSRRCYWAADERGNRRGRSFLAIGSRTYFAKRAAR